MITITNTLSGKCFSCTVPDISFAIDGYRAAVKINVDGSTIYSEYLYPAAGKILLGDLGDLLTPYAQQKLVIDVQILITEEYQDDSTTNNSEIDASVIYCQADFGTTASDFVENHFLSILLGSKITAIGRLEYLHYLGTESATVTAYYDDETNKSFPIVPVGGNDKYTTIDVSPSQFVTEGKVLASYVVTAGSRSQEFDIDFNAPDCAPILIFDNSFGCEELVYCTGTHTVSPTYKRDSTYILGKLQNYNIEETRTFKADSGILNIPMANWLDDLFRSQFVRIVNIYNGTPNIGKEVIITDSKSEYTNKDDMLPRFTFSYQYAQKVQNVIELNRAGRIFDNTFDNTFN